MPMRSIFIPWWLGATPEAPLEAALAIARRVEAHLDVVFIHPDATPVGAGGPGAEAKARFGAWRDRHRLPSGMVEGQLRSTFARWSDRVSVPEQVIVRKGRLSDMTVLRFPDASGALDRPLDAALFESGRPVLLAPETMPADLLRHVAVAWNGSLEATRAVVGARALLYRAERVTVLTTPGRSDSAYADNPVAEDLDLAAALRWHGIQAMHRNVLVSGEDAGAALLQTAREHDVTLLVMGAYTHSRVTTAFLGGVTGHVLRNPPPFPVVMAH